MSKQLLPSTAISFFPEHCGWVARPPLLVYSSILTVSVHIEPLQLFYPLDLLKLLSYLATLIPSFCCVPSILQLILGRLLHSFAEYNVIYVSDYHRLVMSSIFDVFAGKSSVDTQSTLKTSR